MKKKLKLELSDLAIESFNPIGPDEPPGSGTVVGLATWTCDPNELTCGYPCDADTWVQCTNGEACTFTYCPPTTGEVTTVGTCLTVCATCAAPGQGSCYCSWETICDC